MGGKAPDELFGYDVIDGTGQRIGAVDGVWVGDTTNRPAFVGVKTGWLVGKTHIVPLGDARVEGRTLHMPWGVDLIKNAPSFDTGHILTPEDENVICDYYGLNRSTEGTLVGRSRASGRAGDTPTEMNVSGREQIDVPLAEEELQVGKRQVQAGRARIQKTVRTERASQPVEVGREEIGIEEIPATDAAEQSGAVDQELGAVRDLGDVIEIPIVEEELVVTKRRVVKKILRIRKRWVTEQHVVEEDVRREDVEITREGDIVIDGDEEIRSP